jgi:hypothetical protein
MKNTCLTDMTAANPTLVILATLFKKTRTRLFAVAMSLATFTQVLGQPVISSQPQNQTNVAGTTATFTVDGSGTEPLSYQWRSHLNGSSFTNIPFGTQATLVLTNVQYTTRQFAVVVTDSGGLSVTSSPLVRITWLLALTSQPTDQIVVEGATASFRVTTTGTSPSAYQWYFNATSLPGQTNASLTLPRVSDLNTGDYFVTAMNPYGAVTSQLARLTVVPDIFTKITSGPGSGVGNSRGGAWGDYDNDGFIDLFVPQIAEGNGSTRHLLYHNNTDGTFSRVTNGPVAQLSSASRGGAWGDYDNDGHLDLVIVNENQRNSLFHNDGNGSFVPVTNSYTLDVANSRGVTWVDYDNDGYVDLFRSGEEAPRRLHRNNHDGTFTRITGPQFLTVGAGSLGVAWADYNNDGRSDLFLPAVAGSNFLYRNDGGTFTRVSSAFGDSSGGGAWGDYDNDGDLDLFVSRAVTHAQGSLPNLLYRNDGNHTFTSLTSLPTNDPESQGGASFGCTWGDYDNDGWLDLFVANAGSQNDFLYHNNGNGTFTKVLDSVVVNDRAIGLATAWGDYDNDGFLDLFVGGNDSARHLLYHNNGNDNHWLKFRLIGTRSNRAAIGAKVRVRATINGQTFWQMREISGGDGVRGQNSLHVHVGLGNATNADLVRIEWPSGTVQELRDIAANQFLTVTEPAQLQVSGPGEFRVQSWKGMAFEVQASTNLIQWSPMTTVTNLTGTLEFTDPDAANHLQRFYRTVLR